MALSKRTKSFIDELQSRGGWVVIYQGRHDCIEKETEFCSGIGVEWAGWFAGVGGWAWVVKLEIY